LEDVQSKGRVEFKTSPAGFGLGGFALCEFKPGDIVFEIPSDLILSSSSKCVTEDASIKLMLQQDSNITLETSLFVYMAKKKLIGKAEEYIFSLPNQPLHLVENELHGTNVGSQVGKDRVEMISQLEKIHALGDENHKLLTLEQLMIAKYNYNSRRYPLHFDVAGNDNNNNNNDNNDYDNDIHHHNNDNTFSSILSMKSHHNILQIISMGCLLLQNDIINTTTTTCSSHTLMKIAKFRANSFIEAQEIARYMKFNQTTLHSLVENVLLSCCHKGMSNQETNNINGNDDDDNNDDNDDNDNDDDNDDDIDNDNDSNLRLKLVATALGNVVEIRMFYRKLLSLSLSISSSLSSSLSLSSLSSLLSSSSFPLILFVS
jgi:hypothetical protein